MQSKNFKINSTDNDIILEQVDGGFIVHIPHGFKDDNGDGVIPESFYVTLESEDSRGANANGDKGCVVRYEADDTYINAFYEQLISDPNLSYFIGGHAPYIPRPKIQ